MSHLHRATVDMVGTYFLIALWELILTPGISHANSWRGVWVSLLALPLSSFYIAKSTCKTSWFFIYGAGGSLLFVYRWLNQDRFILWLQEPAPSTTEIAIGWVIFALTLGTICWFAALIKIDSIK